MAVSICLIVIGAATIYAVGNPADPSPAIPKNMYADFWQKQVAFAIVGVIGFIFINMINYRTLGAISYGIYTMALILLGIVLLGKYVNIPFVPERNGAYCWIVFRLFGHELPALQPSEFFKLSYVLALSWYLRYRSNYRSFGSLVGPFVLTLVPMLLILPEPDLGTVMLMMPVLFIMVFIAGARVKHLLLIILAAVVVSPLLWHQMNHYQRIRVSSVLLQSKWVQRKAVQYPMIGQILVGRGFSEEQWKSGWGFHLTRSKYAIASGGLGGHGYRNGPFVKYDFLPERHNDFIFAIIAHQWGFWGCLAIFMLYAILIGCGLEIAASNTDPFGRLLAVSIVVVFTVEVLVNLGVTMGLMPITGLTLPLISYGGSSLVVSMLLIGLLNNVGRSRPFSVAPKAFEGQYS